MFVRNASNNDNRGLRGFNWFVTFAVLLSLILFYGLLFFGDSQWLHFAWALVASLLLITHVQLSSSRLVNRPLLIFFTTGSLIVGLAIGYFAQIIFAFRSSQVMLPNHLTIELVLLTTFLAPLAEELYFRGVWFSFVQRLGASSLGVILITSSLWTLAHLAFHPIKMMFIFFIGCALGLLRVHFRSLWPAIGFHVGFNVSYWWWLLSNPPP